MQTTIPSNLLQLELQPSMSDALLLVQRSLFACSITLYRHSVQTAEIAKYVAENAKIEFGCTPAQAYTSGILHDVGKLWVPDEILEKRQSLTDREWEVMQNHPTWGYEFVTGTIFESYGDIIMRHHEKPDGGGYPLGLKMESLELNVRLIILADQVSAFLTDRPYRRRVTHFGLVCRMIKSAVRNLFVGKNVESIEQVLLQFVAEYIKNIPTIEGLFAGKEKQQEIFRTDCVFTEGNSAGCGIGYCLQDTSVINCRKIGGLA